MNYEGNGQLDNPIQRAGGYCSYHGCPNSGDWARVTAAGFVVRYCSDHERKAGDLFTKPATVTRR